MPRSKFMSSSDDAKPIRPALTPEARENQMMGLAIDLAEKQLRDGTASSQVITHFLKLASIRDQLEQEKIRQETKLLEAKTTSLRSEKRVEELYKEALSAMRTYSGAPADDVGEEVGGPDGF